MWRLDAATGDVLGSHVFENDGKADGLRDGFMAATPDRNEPLTVLGGPRGTNRTSRRKGVARAAAERGSVAPLRTGESRRRHGSGTGGGAADRDVAAPPRIGASRRRRGRGRLRARDSQVYATGFLGGDSGYDPSAKTHLRRAELPKTSRGDAAATTWISRGDGVAATPRLRRG